MGRANAAVFPEPVSLLAITSPPPRTRGMHSSWTDVGRIPSSVSAALTRASSRPREFQPPAILLRICGLLARFCILVPRVRLLPQLYVPSTQNLASAQSRKDVPILHVFVLHVSQSARGNEASIAVEIHLSSHLLWCCVQSFSIIVFDFRRGGPSSNKLAVPNERS